MGDLSILLTFILVTIAFVFFRADTISGALSYVTGMLTFGGLSDLNSCAVTVVLVMVQLPVELIQYFYKDDLLAIRRISILIRVPLYTYMSVALLLVSDNDVPFIYFQF